jgi:phosphatidylglycerol:prolipoprotein diacylglycerol transferase
MILYPNFDPVASSIGPIKLRWYGIMYLIGFAAAWWLARLRASRPNSTWKPADIDDFLFYAMVGVILGGRIGYVFFYGLSNWAQDPWYPIRIWEGGMSFHGGLIGVMIAIAIFARRRGRRIADVFDFTAPLPGIGLAAGRIGNFINGELWGKPTDAPWGFIVDPARLHAVQASEANRLCHRFDIDPCVLHVHASQLYEALLEGLVLFIILWIFTSRPRPRLAASGLFLLLYGLFRFAIEFVRVPDEDRGYLAWDWLTAGQVLSAPMIVVGAALLIRAYRRREPSGNLVTSSP